MSATNYPELTQQINRQLSSLRQSQKPTMQGFSAMAQGAMAAGVLSEKHKELMALAIGVSQRCAGCIGFHIKALKRLEATRAELDETLAVAVYMGGGPSLMYAAEALQAWDQFEAC
ncbi:MAG: carboxymuconolactone decarboxylase family protein [Leptothrix ochracea]|uniref:carboxymuconolactone decarboxylase family protein n=1 Tax=Leptothrix ochracea TaxID=735331 RepID=UPI0034E2268E